MLEAVELISFKRLHYFCEVARFKSFRLAARRLGVSQPSLTRHVQFLESELGLVLLQRNQRATRLTEAGQLLVNRASPILREIAALYVEMKSFDNRPTGLVTLAVPASFAQAFLPRLLISFRSKYPDVKIRITEGSTHHVQDWITNGYADIGIIINNLENDNFVIENLMEEQLHLISRPSLDKPSPPISINMLMNLPLILPLPSQGSRQLIDAAAAAAGIQVVPRLEVDSPHIIRDVLMNDDVFTVMPKSAFVHELDAGSLIATPIEAMPSRKLATATLRHEPLSAATRALAREINTVVNQVIRS